MYSLASTALGTLAVGCTLAVHFVQLTAVRQLWSTGARGDYRLIWPSDLFAVEYLAWDLLIGLSLVLASFVFQVVYNITMSAGLAPVKGLTLPLMSYGGSSMIATLAGFGLVLNVRMRRFTN